MDLLPGATLGQYQLLERVGAGGMAEVWRAAQPGLNRIVAIKILPRQLASEPGYLERFRSGAQVIARLNHPNIVPVYDFGEIGGYTYLAMPYLAGGTLQRSLGEAWAVRAAVTILQPLASALEYAHSQYVIHGDVKPSNVLLNDDGRVMLADFGLARITAGTSASSVAESIGGAAFYIPPEQVQGLPPTAASDQYSLAVIAYEMLTGRRPYQAATPLETALAHVHSFLPLPRGVNPAISQEAERALVKALAKAPGDRYASPMAFVQALQASGPAQSAPPRNPTPPPQAPYSPPPQSPYSPPPQPVQPAYPPPQPSYPQPSYPPQQPAPPPQPSYPPPQPSYPPPQPSYPPPQPSYPPPQPGGSWPGGPQAGDSGRPRTYQPLPQYPPGFAPRPAPPPVKSSRGILPIIAIVVGLVVLLGIGAAAAGIIPKEDSSATPTPTAAAAASPSPGASPAAAVGSPSPSPVPAGAPSPSPAPAAGAPPAAAPQPGAPDAAAQAGQAPPAGAPAPGAAPPPNAAAPAPAPAPDARPAAAPETTASMPLEVNPGFGTVGKTNGQGVGLRESPGPGGRVFKTLPDGTPLELNGQAREIARELWVHVRDFEAHEGWLPAAVVAEANMGTPAPAGFTSDAPESKEEPVDPLATVTVPQPSSAIDMAGWQTYHNARFGFIISFPPTWGPPSESTSGDGASLNLGEADSKMTTYASLDPAMGRDPFALVNEAGYRRIPTPMLNGGEGTVIVGKRGLQSVFQMVVVKGDAAYYFYANSTEKFYNANQDLLLQVARTLTPD